MKKIKMIVVFLALLILGSGCGKKEEVYTMDLGTITVNLSEPRTYVRLGLSLSYQGEKNGEMIASKGDVFKDIVITNLVNQPKEGFLDQNSLEEKKGLMKQRMNESMGEEMIGEIYFTALTVGK